MDTAEKIKYIRTNILNLSQEKFAKKLDVSRLTINHWEQKLSKPTAPHISMIAQVSNVTVDYLINDNLPLELSAVGLNNDEYIILKNIVNYFKTYNENNSKNKK
mgnify:FL=1